MSESRIEPVILDGKGLFDFKFDDEGEYFSPDRKFEIEKIIKAELIDRVLTTLASPTHLEIPKLSAYTPARTENGATVLAKGVDETCGYWNIFCKGAAWALRGFEASLADETAESRFKAKYNYLATESWRADNIKWRSAATGFVSK